MQFNVTLDIFKFPTNPKEGNRYNETRMKEKEQSKQEKANHKIVDISSRPYTY